MSTAVDSLINISETKLIEADNLRYCLVKGMDKKPYTIKGELARPNVNEDFVDISKIVDLDTKFLNSFLGIGISIKASGITAIDVDKCFSEPFNFDSIDDRGKYVYEKFKNLAYIEFSLSGKGMRVLYIQDEVPNYTDLYYVKNSTVEIEYYQPSGNARYVTVTGRVIANNPVKSNLNFQNVIIEFLDKYMKHNRQVFKPTPVSNVNEGKDFKELMKVIKIHLFRNSYFQTLWFDDRKEFSRGKGYPGTGESEHDMALLSYLYINITQNKELIKQLFETSPYFETKDYKHKNKWNNQNFRYFNYLYSQLS